MTILNMSAMDRLKEQILATYNKQLSSSPEVANCFKDIEHSAACVVTKKRLFYHLCTQAARDPNFKTGEFYPVIVDLTQQEADSSQHAIEPSVQTKHAASFYKLMGYIPWNGSIDKEMGFAWHETILNDKFATVGFSAERVKNPEYSTIVHVHANNEDDFDSEMDHRTAVEAAFNKLVADEQKSPHLTADEIARIQDHMCCKYKWEMSIANLNVTPMAHGNDELAEDLYALYHSRGYKSAMLTLRGVCQKWGFDTSKLEND